MDITLAKTFLTIVEEGNFRTASEKLFVTQSTVSARIKSLEDQLGKQLFIRNKAGARPTAAGKLFQEYALSFVQLWEKAKNRVSSESIYKEYVSIGARPVLWEPIVTKWLKWANAEFPDVSYRVEIGIAAELIRKLEDSVIDIAILLSAPSIPGISVEELYLEKFLFVVTPELLDSNKTLDELMEKYYVEADWGKEFEERKSHFFPTKPFPQLHVNIGLYGLKYMMENGGCGYFPRTMVSGYIESGQLQTVLEAPIINQPAYVAYNKQELRPIIKPLIQGIRNIA